MIRGPSWRTLRRQLVTERGTISRTLLNIELESVPSLRGTVLDVGSGANASYWRHLRLDPTARLVRVDMVEEKGPDVVADVTQGLPFADGSADAVVLMYVLEHVYDYRRTIVEIARVLRSGGTLYMAVPFLIGVHTEREESFLVEDFFRHSESALRRLLAEDGQMQDVRVIGHGGLFMTVLNLLQPAVKSFQLLALAAGIAGVLDQLVDRRFPQNRQRWVMQYFVAARKA